MTKEQITRDLEAMKQGDMRGAEIWDVGGNLDRIQTDPTSDSSYGRVPEGKTRPVYTEIPPLMKSGLFGPVRMITPENLKPRQETESND